MALAFVQEAGATETVQATSLACSITSTAGHLLVACIEARAGASLTISTVTDSASNTWRLAKRQQQGNTTGEIWYATGAAAVTTVTATASTTATIVMSVAEFSGAAGAGSLVDAVSFGAGSSTAPATTTNGTTALRDEVAVAMVGVSGTTTITGTPGGWTQLTQRTSNVTGAGSKIAAAYQILSTDQTTESYAATLGASASWSTVVATFKVAGELESAGFSAAMGGTPAMSVAMHMKVSPSISVRGLADRGLQGDFPDLDYFIPSTYLPGISVLVIPLFWGWLQPNGLNTPIIARANGITTTSSASTTYASGVITDTLASWTTNQFVGRWITFGGGTSGGTVQSNTATTITLAVNNAGTFWSGSSPSAGAVYTVTSDNAIDRALDKIAANSPTGASNVRIKLRLYGGKRAPAWATTLDSANPFYMTDNSVALPNSQAMGRWWTTNFRNAWNNFQSQLASLYDGNPNVQQVVVGRCATMYPEQCIRQTSDGTGGTPQALTVTTTAGDTSLTFASGGSLPSLQPGAPIVLTGSGTNETVHVSFAYVQNSTTVPLQAAVVNTGQTGGYFGNIYTLTDAAGATSGADFMNTYDIPALQQTIDDAGNYWKTSPIGMSFNPYQTWTGNFSPSPAKMTTTASTTQTASLITRLRNTYGARSVVENFSIRSPNLADPGDPNAGATTSNGYTELYQSIVGAGFPIAYQTAGLAQINNGGAPNQYFALINTLNWAENTTQNTISSAGFANQVELPVGYSQSFADGSGPITPSVCQGYDSGLLAYGTAIAQTMAGTAQLNFRRHLAATMAVTSTWSAQPSVRVLHATLSATTGIGPLQLSSIPLFSTMSVTTMAGAATLSVRDTLSAALSADTSAWAPALSVATGLSATMSADTSVASATMVVADHLTATMSVATGGTARMARGIGATLSATMGGSPSLSLAMPVLAATLPVITGLSPTLSLAQPRGASFAATTGMTAALSVANGLTATMSATQTASATLSVANGLSATLVVVSGATAAPAVSMALSGTCASTTGITASLAVIERRSGTFSADTSVATATMSVAMPLAATLAVVTGGSVLPSGSMALSATMSATSAAGPVPLNLGVALAATLSAAMDGTPALRLVIPLLATMSVTTGIAPQFSLAIPLVPVTLSGVSGGSATLSISSTRAIIFTADTSGSTATMSVRQALTATLAVAMAGSPALAVAMALAAGMTVSCGMTAGLTIVDLSRLRGTSSVSQSASGSSGASTGVRASSNVT